MNPSGFFLEFRCEFSFDLTLREADWNRTIYCSEFEEAHGKRVDAVILKVARKIGDLAARHYKEGSLSVIGSMSEEGWAEMYKLVQGFERHLKDSEIFFKSFFEIAHLQAQYFKPTPQLEHAQELRALLYQNALSERMIHVLRLEEAMLGVSDCGMRKPDDSAVAQKQMVDTVHRSVRPEFFWETIVAGDVVFGVPSFPGEGASAPLGAVYGDSPMHGGEIEPMVRPSKGVLSIAIDQLEEEDPVERWVLTKEDSFLMEDSALSETVDDALSRLLDGHAPCDLLPSETVDFQTLPIAFFPKPDGLSYDCLELVSDRSSGQIDDLKCNLEDAMDVGVQPIGFCIEKNADHSGDVIN